MAQIVDFFSSIGAYLGTGGAMLVAGIVLLITARRAEPENRKVMKWIGWPLIGCGGCLVVVPIIIILAIVGLGLMMLSCEVPGC